MPDNPTEQTKNAIIEQSPAQTIVERMPLICGDYKNFHPTQAMRETLWCWMQLPEVSQTQILVQLGYSRNNWYKWMKTDKFLDWWYHAINDTLGKNTLAEVKRHHAHLSQKTTDTGMIKLFYQIADPSFTERTSADTKHTFAGFTPDDADNAAERSKKRIESTVASD